MKKKTIRTLLIAFLALAQISAFAQDTWASHSNHILAKGYEGHKFRFSAFVKTDIADDSAAVRLWVREDKDKGMGFFDNMWERPIRSRTWQKYVIEGSIDATNTNQMYFGAMTFYNGSFYCDDLKLEIEIQQGQWKALYQNDFEGDSLNIAQPTLNTNNLYTAEIWKNEAAQGRKCLKITGKGVPIYGMNKKVGKYADVNGIKLYYEIYGEGQPLVVLHGNGGSIDYASSLYSDFIKKYKVIAIDSRGQGKSTDTNDPMTYDKMASDVNELLEQLKIDSVLIFGHSDGAILGLLLALDYPKKVKKVLAFAPNMQPDSLAIFPWAIAYINRAIKAPKNATDKKLNEMMRDYPNVPYSKLSKIKAPVLIMGGDRDVIRPEHLLKLFQSIPNSQMCIVPGATHSGCWDKKDLFMTILSEFFDKPFEMPTTEDWLKE